MIVNKFLSSVEISRSNLIYKKETWRKSMLLASGHHRIMVAARGALVMMVLGKVENSSRPTYPDVSAAWKLSELAVMLRMLWSCLGYRRKEEILARCVSLDNLRLVGEWRGSCDLGGAVLSYRVPLKTPAIQFTSQIHCFICFILAPIICFN